LFWIRNLTDVAFVLLSGLIQEAFWGSFEHRASMARKRSRKISRVYPAQTAPEASGEVSDVFQALHPKSKSSLDLGR
jgi:hypothetical protein